jgi:hypothetical protein
MFELGVPLFPERSSALEAFGLKFSGGGAHISRTMIIYLHYTNATKLESRKA